MLLITNVAPRKEYNVSSESSVIIPTASWDHLLDAESATNTYWTS